MHPTPQTAIFEASGPHHCFLEYTIPRDTPRDQVASALHAARELAQNEAALELVVAFSGPLWSLLTSGPPPALLLPFRTMRGRTGKTVPGTQNDLWLWLSAAEKDRVFAATLAIHETLRSTAALRLEQAAFNYLDSRDLTGFIDGTANPAGDERAAVALVPDGRAEASGSYLIAQRWEHDLEAFHGLPLREQEETIGRRKADSEELPPAEKPVTAHISRVEVEEDGEEVAIFRRSVPFGTIGRNGLYFVAFSADPVRFDLMLRRMYGLTDDGVEDRLTDFSRPTSSAYYFAPSQQALAGALGRG